MNSYEHNDFCYPVIKAWSTEDMLYEQEDSTSVLSFLREEGCGAAKFRGMSYQEESFDFGLNWLAEEDRRQVFVPETLKSKARAASFHAAGRENFVESILCEESAPRVSKTLAKAHQLQKSKPKSVNTVKSRNT